MSENDPVPFEIPARRAPLVVRRLSCDWCGEPGEWQGENGIYCTDCYEQFVGPVRGAS